MSRILVGDEWYDLVSPNSFYEEDFESQILARADHIFPEWHLVRFKKRVTAPELGMGIPDLALIDREYRNWWVVEVEMGRHSLEEHVEPQVMVFTHARYGEPEADHLTVRSGKALERERTRALLRNVQPRVLIVVDRDRPDWQRVLDHYGALVCAFSVYQARTGKCIFRLRGEMPTTLGAVVSLCRTHPSMPKALLVENASALSGKPGELIEIEMDSGSTKWRYTPLGNTLFLFAVGRFPLDQEGGTFLLSRSESGALRLRKSNRNMTMKLRSKL